MDKLLTESGLKAILSKNKIKDNGLQRALSVYEKLGDDEHDECLDQLTQIGKLAAALKKSKEVAANKAAIEYLEDLLDAADGEEKDVSKDKAAAEKDAAADKKAKDAKDAKDKKKDKDDKDEDEDEDEDEEKEEEDEEEELEGDYETIMMSGLKKVKSAGGDPYQFLYCDARPLPMVMVARRIGSRHRKMLTELTGGCKKFLRIGTCHFEDNKYVITLEQEVAGVARKTQKSLKGLLGKRYPIVCGQETAGLEDEEGEDEGEQEDESGKVPGSKGTPDGQIPQPGEDIPTGPQDQADGGTAPEGAEAGGGGGQAQGGADAGGGAGEAQGGADAGDKPPVDMTAPFSIKGAVGRGGKNAQEDVQAVQIALNKQAKAGLKVDGQCGPKTIAAITAYQKTLGQPNPDGVVSPGRGTARGLAGLAQPSAAPAGPPKPVAPPTLPKAQLGKAPEIWNKTRDILKTNIDELKKAVQGHYASEHPDLVKGINQGLGKLDGILETLDTKLSDSLGKAHAASGDAARKAELQNSKTILTEYIKYVKAEPMIAHIDKNPFGVDTNIKKVLSDALTHMAQAMS